MKGGGSTVKHCMAWATSTSGLGDLHTCNAPAVQTIAFKSHQ